MTFSPAVRHGKTYQAVAPMGVDVLRAIATLAVVLHLPTRPFFVSDCPPATNIFPVN
ncbi:MAG: hypothetical protein O4859_12060 [Trichodesmium sp. St18_bin1]|nr:hypothetical protein [Trichodesmium sp. St18_bin1]